MNESSADDGRRPPILKQRYRQPLQEVPFFYGDEETTSTLTFTQGRRVSFGRRNHIKEYIPGTAASTQAVHEYDESNESVSEASMDMTGPLDLANKSCLDINDGNADDEEFQNENLPPFISPPDSFNDPKPIPQEPWRRFTEQFVSVAKSVFENPETSLTAIIIGAKAHTTDEERRSTPSKPGPAYDATLMQESDTELRLSPKMTTFCHKILPSSSDVSRSGRSKFGFLDGPLNMSLGSFRSQDHVKFPLSHNSENQNPGEDMDMEETCHNPLRRHCQDMPFDMSMNKHPSEGQFPTFANLSVGRQVSMEETCHRPIDMAGCLKAGSSNVPLQSAKQVNTYATERSDGEESMEETMVFPLPQNVANSRQLDLVHHSMVIPVDDSFNGVEDSIHDPFGRWNRISSLQHELETLKEGNQSFINELNELPKSTSFLSQNMSAALVTTPVKVICVNSPMGADEFDEMDFTCGNNLQISQKGKFKNLIAQSPARGATNSPRSTMARPLITTPVKMVNLPPSLGSHADKDTSFAVKSFFSDDVDAVDLTGCDPLPEVDRGQANAVPTMVPSPFKNAYTGRLSVPRDLNNCETSEPLPKVDNSHYISAILRASLNVLQENSFMEIENSNLDITLPSLAFQDEVQAEATLNFEKVLVGSTIISDTQQNVDELAGNNIKQDCPDADPLGNPEPEIAEALNIVSKEETLHSDEVVLNIANKSNLFETVNLPLIHSDSLRELDNSVEIDPLNITRPVETGDLRTVSPVRSNVRIEDDFPLGDPPQALLNDESYKMTVMCNAASTREPQQDLSCIGSSVGDVGNSKGNEENINISTNNLTLPETSVRCDDGKEIENSLCGIKVEVLTESMYVTKCPMDVETEADLENCNLGITIAEVLHDENEFIQNRSVRMEPDMEIEKTLTTSTVRSCDNAVDDEIAQRSFQKTIREETCNLGITIAEVLHDENKFILNRTENEENGRMEPDMEVEKTLTTSTVCSCDNAVDEIAQRSFQNITKEEIDTPMDLAAGGTLKNDIGKEGDEDDEVAQRSFQKIGEKIGSPTGSAEEGTLESAVGRCSAIPVTANLMPGNESKIEHSDGRNILVSNIVDTSSSHDTCYESRAQVVDGMDKSVVLEAIHIAVEDKNVKAQETPIKDLKLSLNHGQSGFALEKEIGELYKNSPTNQGRTAESVMPGFNDTNLRNKSALASWKSLSFEAIENEIYNMSIKYDNENVKDVTSPGSSNVEVLSVSVGRNQQPTRACEGLSNNEENICVTNESLRIDCQLAKMSLLDEGKKEEMKISSLRDLSLALSPGKVEGSFIPDILDKQSPTNDCLLKQLSQLSVESEHDREPTYFRTGEAANLTIPTNYCEFPEIGGDESFTGVFASSTRYFGPINKDHTPRKESNSLLVGAGNDVSIPYPTTIDVRTVEQESQNKGATLPQNKTCSIICPQQTDDLLSKAPNSSGVMDMEKKSHDSLTSADPKERLNSQNEGLTNLERNENVGHSRIVTLKERDIVRNSHSLILTQSNSLPNCGIVDSEEAPTNALLEKMESDTKDTNAVTQGTNQTSESQGVTFPEGIVPQHTEEAAPSQYLESAPGVNDFISKQVRSSSQMDKFEFSSPEVRAKSPFVTIQGKRGHSESPLPVKQLFKKSCVSNSPRPNREILPQDDAVRPNQDSYREQQERSFAEIPPHAPVHSLNVNEVSMSPADHSDILVANESSQCQMPGLSLTHVPNAEKSCHMNHPELSSFKITDISAPSIAYPSFCAIDENVPSDNFSSSFANISLHDVHPKPTNEEVSDLESVDQNCVTPIKNSNVCPNDNPFLQAEVHTGTSMSVSKNEISMTMNGARSDDASPDRNENTRRDDSSVTRSVVQKDVLHDTSGSVETSRIISAAQTFVQDCVSIDLQNENVCHDSLSGALAIQTGMSMSTFENKNELIACAEQPVENDCRSSDLLTKTLQEGTVMSTGNQSAESKLTDDKKLSNKEGSINVSVREVLKLPNDTCSFEVESTGKRTHSESPLPVVQKCKKSRITSNVTKPFLIRHVLSSEGLVDKVHQDLLKWSKDPNCPWRFEEFRVNSIDMPGHFQASFPLLDSRLMISIEFDSEHGLCRVRHVELVERDIPERGRCPKHRIITNLGLEAWQLHVLEEETKIKTDFSEVPIFMDLCSAFCRRLQPVLQQAVTILKGYAGAKLFGFGLRFRLYSLPTLMSCFVEVDLYEMILLSRCSKLKFISDMGVLDEDAIYDVLRESWHGSSPLLSFVKGCVTYLIEEERKVKCITKRPPLRF